MKKAAEISVNINNQDVDLKTQPEGVRPANFYFGKFVLKGTLHREKLSNRKISGVYSFD